MTDAVGEPVEVEPESDQRDDETEAEESAEGDDATEE